MVEVKVMPGKGEQAIKELKRKMQRNLVFRNMKKAASYIKPSEKRVRSEQEKARRIRKLMRKRNLDE